MAVSIMGFNVGTDVSFEIVDSFGDIILDQSLGYLEDFSTAPIDSSLKITPITTGGVPIYQTIWNGGRGSLTYTRFGTAFQQMFLDLISAYHEGGVIPQFTMTQNVRNRDSSIDTYVYEGFQFTGPSFGDYRATSPVALRTGFNWSICKASGSLNQFLQGLAGAL